MIKVILSHCGGILLSDPLHYNMNSLVRGVASKWIYKVYKGYISTDTEEQKCEISDAF